MRVTPFFSSNCDELREKMEVAIHELRGTVGAAAGPFLTVINIVWA